MRTAFFPGKFQPLHLGHIITINRLLEDYDEVIIGVTESGPRVKDHTPEFVKRSLETVFKHITPDKKVSVVLLPGTMIEWSKEDAANNLYFSFDYLVTASNMDVVLWAKKMGIPVKNIERSEGFGFTGSVLRRILNEFD